jgi:hypothetical protein
MKLNSAIQINKLLTLSFLSIVLFFSGSFTIISAKEDVDPDLEKAADQYNKNKSNEKYQVVCKREAPVGSRIKKKVCRTVAMNQNSQRQIKKTMQKMRTSVGNQP